MFLYKNSENRFWFLSYLISVPCGMYIYGFFPAPYYIFFICSIFGLLFIHPRICSIKSAIMLTLTLFSFVILLYTSKINVWSYYLIGFVSFYYLMMFSSNISNERLRLIIRHVVFLTLIISVSDTLYRFLFPKYEYIDAIIGKGNDDLIFYAYKHSFFFQDSNFIGLYLISVFFLLLNNSNCFSKNLFLFSSISIFVLIVLTFSRAAIVAVLIGLLYCFYIKRLNGKNKLMLSFLMIFLLSIILFIMQLYDGYNLIGSETDGSLLTKFYILDKFFLTISEREIYIFLFGWGFNNTMDYWGIAAHNLFFTLILESGIIGFMIFISPFLYYAYNYKMVSPQVLSIFVTSLSFGIIFSPVTVPFALNIISEMKNEGEVNIRFP
ncbi:O-antigen ligase family protein [Vibrio mimicus]